MKYFINQNKDSFVAMAAGDIPKGFNEVSESEYNEFALSLEEKKNEAKNKIRSRASAKLSGVLFEGVMCSATKIDQDGLTAVFSALTIGAMKKTVFKFDNGNKLLITKSNFKKFASVWGDFRQSFFTAEN
jgi:hypothetical protein